MLAVYHGIVYRMSKRYSLSGARISGKHTSLIPLAYEVATELLRSEEVDKISPGIITTSVRNLGGNLRIKIVPERSNILLRVRDNGALQEVRVFGDNEHVRQLLAMFAQQNHTVELYE